MKCPSCATDLPDGSKFCGACGSSIGPAAPAPHAPQAPAAPMPAHTVQMTAQQAAQYQQAPLPQAQAPMPQTRAPMPHAGPVGGPMAHAAPGGPVPTIDEVIARGVHLPIGDSLSQAWEIFKPHMWLIIGIMLVVGAIASFAANTLIGMIALGPIYAGFDIVILRLVGGRPFEFSNAFDGFKKFVPFMILGLLRFALIFGGYFLLVLPGIYLAMATTWAWFLHIDRGMEPWDAIKASIKVVNSNFFGHFGFFFVLGLVASLGAMACYVGALVTMPVAYIALAIAYRNNFGLMGGAERL